MHTCLNRNLNIKKNYCHTKSYKERTVMGSAKSQVVSGSEVVLEMQSPKERKETAISSRRLFDSSTCHKKQVHGWCDGLNKNGLHRLIYF